MGTYLIVFVVLIGVIFAFYHYAKLTLRVINVIKNGDKSFIWYAIINGIFSLVSLIVFILIVLNLNRFNL